MSVEDSWKRIAAWYRQASHGDEEIQFRLASGAVEEQITALEQVLGIPLPDDMRQSYRSHNGTDGTWLVHYRELLSLAEIDTRWRIFAEDQNTGGWGLGDEYEPLDIGFNGRKGFDPAAAEAIKPIWWNRRRIPVTDISGADPIFVDLDPASGGTFGQIITYSHELGPLRVIARSWSEWLMGIAQDLETGKLAYDKQFEMVCPPGYYDE